MDRLDFDIMLELHRDPWISNAQIGNRLHAPTSTVGRRLRQLTKDRVLGPLIVIPHPGIYGRREVFVAFSDVHYPDLDAILALEDVVWVGRNHPNMLVVMVHTKEGHPDHVEEAVGGERVMVAAVEPPLGEANRHLSTIATRVLSALVAHPDATIQQLAKRAGVHHRTFIKHRRALIAKRQMSWRINVDMRQAAGPILFAIYASGPPEALTALEREGMSRVMEHTEPSAAYALGLGTTYQEVIDTHGRLAGARGVDTVALTIPEGAKENRVRVTRWLDGP